MRTCFLLVVVVLLAEQLACQAIVQGTPYTTSTTPAGFSMTPTGGWNALGVTSASTDWGIRVGTVYQPGQGGLGVIDLAISANGTGPGAFFTPNEIARFTGSGDAYIQHAAVSTVTTGGVSAYSWQNFDVVHIWTVSIAQQGISVVSVSGSSDPNFRWYVFSPDIGDSWNPRTNATAGPLAFTQPGAINFNRTGAWCIAVVHDNGPLGSTASIQVSVPTPVALPDDSDKGGGGDDGGCSTSDQPANWLAILGVLIALAVAGRLVQLRSCRSPDGDIHQAP